eukprot:PhF_6_TR25303/c0_g1_i1/m.34925
MSFLMLLESSYSERTTYLIAAMPLVSVFGLCVLPSYNTFSSGRATFWRTIAKIFILPFGRVNFRDFFVTDWTVSLNVVLVDIVSCLLGYMGLAVAYPRGYYQPAVLCLPSFWRMCHCLKMYSSTRRNIHLINFSKYATNLLTIGTWVVPPEVIPICFRVLSVVANCLFTILIDFGWIRGKERAMQVSVQFHATVISYEIFCRTLNLASMYAFLLPIDPDIILTVMLSVEVVRRGVWSIIRIENECVSNIEKYRSVDLVPNAERFFSKTECERYQW